MIGAFGTFGGPYIDQILVRRSITYLGTFEYVWNLIKQGCSTVAASSQIILSKPPSHLVISPE
jgi:hypothetical protein